MLTLSVMKKHNQLRSLLVKYAESDVKISRWLTQVRDRFFDFQTCNAPTARGMVRHGES
jgi:hypothetical protein